jgi:hypothetical protein
LLLMTEIASELDDRGYEIQLLRSDGTTQDPQKDKMTFIQRGGAPSGIRPASQGPHGPTSIVFRRAKGLRRWEIWNGVQFVGRSGGRHEFDIAVVPKRLGNALRNHPSGGRPFGHGWLSIECKDLATNGSVDEMRAFVARVYDTTFLTLHASHMGAAGSLRKVYARDVHGQGFGTAKSTYRLENQNSFHAIARRSGFTTGSAPMSAYYFVRRFDDLAVGSAELDTFTQEICDWIDINLPTTI